MEPLETSGIVIDVGKNEYGAITSIDLFTQQHGILHWFNRKAIDSSRECLLDEIAVVGEKSTETAGNLITTETIFRNSEVLRANGAFDHAITFVKILRQMVFDGVELENLFLLTKQAIANFMLDFDRNVVLLKALYLLCREEGYAVDTIWLKSLSLENQALAKAIIHSKFDVDAPPQAQILANSLKTWMLSL